MNAPFTNSNLHSAPQIHIRFEGRSYDVSLSDLDVGILSSDVEVKNALTQYLGIPQFSLRDYVIDRHQTGNLTIRPMAVFG